MDKQRQIDRSVFCSVDNDAEFRINVRCYASVNTER